MALLFRMTEGVVAISVAALAFIFVADRI